MENVVSCLVCCICVCRPDTSDFNKLTLLNALLSEVTNTLQIPLNIPALQIEPGTLIERQNVGDFAADAHQPPDVAYFTIM